MEQNETVANPPGDTDHESGKACVGACGIIFAGLFLLFSSNKELSCHSSAKPSSATTNTADSLKAVQEAQAAYLQSHLRFQ